MNNIKFQENLLSSGNLQEKIAAQDDLKSAKEKLREFDAKIAEEVKQFEEKSQVIDLSLGGIRQSKEMFSEKNDELEKLLVLTKRESEIHFRLVQLKLSAIPEFLTFKTWDEERLLKIGHEKYKELLMLIAWNCMKEMQRFQDTISEIINDLVQYNREKNKTMASHEEDKLIIESKSLFRNS